MCASGPNLGEHVVPNCLVPDCGKTHKARGFCSTHYEGCFGIQKEIE